MSSTGAGTERIADMDLTRMVDYLDWINIMTYDFHGRVVSFLEFSFVQFDLQAAGGWEQKTGHNAPLFPNNDETTTDVSPSFIKSKYNCHGAVQGYINAGVPRSKLVMGLALYGRGWQGKILLFCQG